MQLFDADHPFFRPLWRRVAIVAVCLGWAAFEFASASPFWGALFGGVGVYCAWALLINYRPDTDTQ